MPEAALQDSNDEVAHFQSATIRSQHDRRPLFAAQDHKQEAQCATTMQQRRWTMNPYLDQHAYAHSPNNINPPPREPHHDAVQSIPTRAESSVLALHELLRAHNLEARSIENIQAIRRNPSWIPPIRIMIATDEKEAII